MEGKSALLSRRDTLLLELKSIIKQVYHEAVNHELSLDNVNYITNILIKTLDETLLFGLKTPQNGYWKIVNKILHKNALSQLTAILGFGHSNHTKARAWIASSLLDDSLISYINCFLQEKTVSKFYEDWSIVRHCDACNSFLSLLSGLENVSIQFDIVDASSSILNCKLTARLMPTAPWSPALSLADSGVQLDKSDDYLNGNLPGSGGVVMRRKSKNTLRHVSFHEDSLGKSPTQRKLRWDVENSRYSWGGEELDGFQIPSLRKSRSQEEREAPEGEESPLEACQSLKESRCFFKSSANNAVRRPLADRANRRARRLSTRRFRVNWDVIDRFNQEIEAEMSKYKRPRSVYEVHLPEKLRAMLGLRGVRLWCYKLWAKMLIITAETIIILHKDLTSTVLTLQQVEQVVVYPHGHELQLLTRKQTHSLRCGDHQLTHEILTRIAYQMHKANNNKTPTSVDFRILQPQDMYHVKQELINRRVLTEGAIIAYMGVTRQQLMEDRLIDSSVPDKQGYLMYQTGTAKEQLWKPANVTLRGGVLFLYREDNSPLATISLLSCCKGCDRSFFPDRPHTFTLSLNYALDLDESSGLYQSLAQLSPQSSSRYSSMWMENALQRLTQGMQAGDILGQWLTGVSKQSPSGDVTVLHLAAADEYEMSDWLQALFAVFCQGSEEKRVECEASEASLVITEDTAVLFTQPDYGQSEGFRVLASALIHDISSLSVGCHPHDSYCIIELECMEAGSGTSDWVLHFGSRAELDQCRLILEQQWKLPHPFPYNSIEDARCERTQECLAREWFV